MERRSFVKSLILAPIMAAIATKIDFDPIPEEDKQWIQIEVKDGGYKYYWYYQKDMDERLRKFWEGYPVAYPESYSMQFLDMSMSDYENPELRLNFTTA